MAGRRWLLVALGAMAVGLSAAQAVAEDEFPLDGELVLDARPLPGSKRIPNMDIETDGTMVLEMWCNRVDGQVVVAGNTITVMTGTPTDRPCTPQQSQADTLLIETLNAVTNWRRDGDLVLLIGPKTLRFMVPTN